MLWAQRFEIRWGRRRGSWERRGDRRGEGWGKDGSKRESRGWRVCSNVWQTVCNSHNQQLEDTLGTLFQSLPPSSLPPLPALHAVQPQKFKFAQLKLNSKAAQLLSGTAEVLLLASSPCYVWSGPTSEFVCVNWTNVPLCVDVLTSKCTKNWHKLLNFIWREWVGEKGKRENRKKVMQLLYFLSSTFSRYLKKSKQSENAQCQANKTSKYPAGNLKVDLQIQV